MTTYQLKHQAKLLHDKADEMIRLAGEVESLPDPIGDAIGTVVAMLARHGLCVINQEALSDVADLLTQAELEDTQDWDSAMKSSVEAVHKSLGRRDFA